MVGSKLLTQWLILHTLMAIAFSAKILAYLPVPAKSHHIVFTPLLHELARRGHQVTVLSPFPAEKTVPNITHIYIHTQAEDDFKSKVTSRSV